MNIADKSTRLITYVTDTVIFIVIVMVHIFILFGLLHIIPLHGSTLLNIYFFVLYFAYYFLFEYFIGSTPGKLFTGTKVTNIDGEKPTKEELFIRNICRLIPFDNLSFLFTGAGWHDSISETRVVYLDKSNKVN